jgi:hypothetical protein
VILREFALASSSLYIPNYSLYSVIVIYVEEFQDQALCTVPALITNYLSNLCNTLLIIHIYNCFFIGTCFVFCVVDPDPHYFLDQEMYPWPANPDADPDTYYFVKDTRKFKNFKK